MLTLVCSHPHCNAEATDEVALPRVRWLLCAHHAGIERAFSAAIHNASTKRGATVCELPGCGGVVRARGLCRSHYDRAWRRGLLDPPERDRRRAADERREQAAIALRTLPGIPPELALSTPLAAQPPWVQTAVRITDAWAGLRQELHRVAEIPL